jgi:hypothetical protein
MPVILATQEAEIRKIVVRSQPGQIQCEPLSRKKKRKRERKREGGGEGRKEERKKGRKEINLAGPGFWVFFTSCMWERSDVLMFSPLA